MSCFSCEAANEAVNQPTRQPVSQRGSQSANKAASQPTRQPVSQTDFSRRDKSGSRNAAEEAANMEDNDAADAAARQWDSQTDFSRHFKMFKDKTILEKINIHETIKTLQEHQTFLRCFTYFSRKLGLLGLLKFSKISICSRLFEIFLKSHAFMHKFCACLHTASIFLDPFIV